MKTIRRNTFETNSSSTHSISIYNSKEAFDTIFSDSQGNTEGDLHIDLMEIGWGWETYDSPYDKLRYILTTIACWNGANSWCDNCTEEELEESRQAIYSDHNFNTLVDYLKKHTKFDNIVIDSLEGYIDHQSCVYDLNELCDEAGCDSIEEFIFSPSIKIRQGNDNDIDPEER